MEYNENLGPPAPAAVLQFIDEVMNRIQQVPGEIENLALPSPDLFDGRPYPRIHDDIFAEVQEEVVVEPIALPIQHVNLDADQIQIIENDNVENVANVVEVRAIDENAPENAPENLPEVPEAPEAAQSDDAAPAAAEHEAPEPEAEKPRKKRKLEAEKPKAPSPEPEDCDEGHACPICMEPWTNSGEHRLCSLACGHLFGHKCVLRWLKHECTAQNRRCPHCNTKAQMKDIRMIYASSLSAVDTIELDRLKGEVQTLLTRNKNLEHELSSCQLRNRVAEDKVRELREKVKDLENEKMGFKMELRGRGKELGGPTKKFHLEKTFEFGKDALCRVLDYNSWYGYIAVSHKASNPLFPGYGIKKIDTNKFEQLQFTMLHTQPIRDMSFHPTEQSMLLTASFDKTAKLVDIHNNQVMHAFPVDSQLWSSCWAGDNGNIFIVGSQKGFVTQFDIRQTAGALDTRENPTDHSPVVSLASVPPLSSDGITRGGFLACQLNSCWTYEPRNNIYTPKRILQEGPFTCVRYDTQNHHALISCRPNNANPQVRHVMCSIERGTEDTVVCNTAHTFLAGHTQKDLSRPCFVDVTSDTFVAAHHEATKSVAIWDISTGKEVQNILASNPVGDMCSFRLQGSVVLGALSSMKLRLYNYEQP